ncbi:SDR family oxidoreductase [Candidatus Micrarchaeota archaeon]|nr:SDR family oxidoreductase [Candidatus Micrarchaeota archaeon]
MTHAIQLKQRSTVLITGGSQGIGRAMADEFAAHGFDVVLVARHQDMLEKAKNELENRYHTHAHIIAIDLTAPGAVEKVYKETKRKRIPVEILVNNAGFGSWGLFHENRWKIEANELQLNIVALSHLTHAYLQDMVKAKHGKILNVSSIVAFQPGPFMAVYYASKAYVNSFSEALSEELKGTGVTVTTLCPGATQTKFHERAGVDARSIPKAAWMSAQDVAEAGYEGMMKGKRIVIPGNKNQVMIWLSRITPKSILLKAVRRFQENR